MLVVDVKYSKTYNLQPKLNNNVWYCFPIGRKRMAESDDNDDDDGVEEDESDGDLETSRKLFFQKSKWKKEKETWSESQVLFTGT